MRSGRLAWDVENIWCDIVKIHRAVNMGEAVKMKRLFMVLFFALSIAGSAASIIMAASAGPVVLTHPQVTATICPSSSPTAGSLTQILPASTAVGNSQVVNRLCYIVQNFSTANSVMVGNQNISGIQGVAIGPVPSGQPTPAGAVGGTTVICTNDSVNACGVGAAAVVGVTEINRQ